MSRSPTLFSSEDEDEGPDLEESLLKKFQIMMQGVPPPPSVTMCKLSVADMLAKYNENKDSLGFSDVESKKPYKRDNKTPLVFYYNSSNTSEEIANISQKVLCRYVHSETMSTCNIWFEDSAKSNSAKKHLRRSALGFSPGSRLSHLARRRQVFSSENLQKLANSEKRCQIQIGKINTSKSKSFVKSSTIEIEKSNSFKRALFLSPEDSDEGKHRKLLFSSQQNLVSDSYNSDNLEGTAKEYHWVSQRDPNTSSSKKRKRLDSRERNGNWPRRALTFSDKDLGQNQNSNSSNIKVISEIQLNLHHKTKILWAVSVALKEKHIGSSNPAFKPSASALFMICRKNLSKILNLKIEGGTSDKILHFAREHVDEILKKLNVSTQKEVDVNKKTCGTSTDNSSCSRSNLSKNNSDIFLKGESILAGSIGNTDRTISNNETISVSAKNQCDSVTKHSATDEVPLLTISTVVEVNAASQEKENINIGESNYNLVT